MLFEMSAWNAFYNSGSQPVLISVNKLIHIITPVALNIEKNKQPLEVTVANVNTIITSSKLEQFPSLVWGKILVHKENKIIKSNFINTHLSLDMLQSIIVLLLVLTIKKGSCIVEVKDGGPWFCCSFCWFLCTKFLNAICCKTKERKNYHCQ